MKRQEEQQLILELLLKITRRLARQIAPYAAAEDLSLTEVLVLRKMSLKRACRVTEIAADIGVSPSTLTGVLDRLVHANWLERTPDPDDRRAILMKTTPKVATLFKRLMSKSGEKMTELFSGFPKPTLHRMVDDLQAFLECLERDGAD